MIIGRAVPAPTLAVQFGLNWYAIDRGGPRRGQGGIAVIAAAVRRCGIPPRAGSSAGGLPPDQSRCGLSACWIALKTWLGRNGLAKKPSGCAALARCVVSASAR